MEGEAWCDILAEDLRKQYALNSSRILMIPMMSFGPKWNKKPTWETPRIAQANVFRLWAYTHGDECGSCC